MALTSGGGSGIPGLQLVAYGVFSGGVGLAGNYGMTATISGNQLVVVLAPTVVGKYVVYAETMGINGDVIVSSKLEGGFRLDFKLYDGSLLLPANTDCVIQVYK